MADGSTNYVGGLPLEAGQALSLELLGANIIGCGPMFSPRSGRPVANQVVLSLALSNPDLGPGYASHFLSYGKVIASVVKSEDGSDAIFLRKGLWNNVSYTTNRYLNQYLGTNGVRTIRRMVRDGKVFVLDEMGIIMSPEEAV